MDKLSQTEATFRETFKKFLHLRAAWRSGLLEFLEGLRQQNLEAYLFGGTLRDIWLYGPRCTPRDLDIVLSDESFDRFQKAYDAQIVKRNRFGGLKCRAGGMLIDAWPLESTWAFKKGHFDKPSFEALTKTAYFNLDAVAAEIFPLAPRRKRRIFGDVFFAGVIAKEIEVNFEPNDFQELNILRGFRLAHRTRFAIGNRFARLIRSLVYHGDLTKFIAIQKEHYGRVLLSEALLWDLFEQIFATLDRRADGCIRLVFPRDVQLRFESYDRLPSEPDTSTPAGFSWQNQLQLNFNEHRTDTSLDWVARFKSSKHNRAV